MDVYGTNTWNAHTAVGTVLLMAMPQGIKLVAQFVCLAFCMALEVLKLRPLGGVYKNVSLYVCVYVCVCCRFRESGTLATT